MWWLEPPLNNYDHFFMEFKWQRYPYVLNNLFHEPANAITANCVRI